MSLTDTEPPQPRHALSLQVRSPPSLDNQTPTMGIVGWSLSMLLANARFEIDPERTFDRHTVNPPCKWVANPAMICVNTYFGAIAAAHILRKKHAGGFPLFRENKNPVCESPDAGSGMVFPGTNLHKVHGNKNVCR